MRASSENKTPPPSDEYRKESVEEDTTTKTRDAAFDGINSGAAENEEGLSTTSKKSKH